MNVAEFLNWCGSSWHGTEAILAALSLIELTLANRNRQQGPCVVGLPPSEAQQAILGIGLRQGTTTRTGRRVGGNPHRPASRVSPRRTLRGISPRRWPAAANQPARHARRGRAPPVTVAELSTARGEPCGDQTARGVNGGSNTRSRDLTGKSGSGALGSEWSHRVLLPNCLLGPIVYTRLSTWLGPSFTASRTRCAPRPRALLSALTVYMPPVRHATVVSGHQEPAPGCHQASSSALINTPLPSLLLDNQ